MEFEIENLEHFQFIDIVEDERGICIVLLLRMCAGEQKGGLPIIEYGLVQFGPWQLSGG